MCGVLQWHVLQRHEPAGLVSFVEDLLLLRIYDAHERGGMSTQFRSHLWSNALHSTLFVRARARWHEPAGLFLSNGL